MSKLKPLVIKVNENSVPNGDPYKWNNISEQIESFTRDIITPDLNISKDGKTNANIAPHRFWYANYFCKSKPI